MKGIKNIILNVLFCVSLFVADMSIAQALPPLQNNNDKPIRILSIEGGGIYGILSVSILQAIEQSAHQPISQLFDIMVGTSTGAIQIALLSTPKPGTHQPLYSAQDVLHFYLHSAKTILHVPWYRKWLTVGGLLSPLLSQEKLERYGKEKLGNATLQDTLTTILIPVYDLNTASLFLFNSADTQQKNDSLVDIVLASTAMPNVVAARPYLFPDGEHYLTDATIIANNPTLLALFNAMLMYPDRPKIIVSLGAGKLLPAAHPKAQGQKGLLGIMNNWLNMIYQGNDHTLSDILQEQTKKHRFNLIGYYRLNPLMPEGVGSPIDVSAHNIALLKNAADAYIKNNQAQIVEIATLLKRDDA